MSTEDVPSVGRLTRPAGFDDFANADRFVDQWGDNYRYCFAERRHYAWDETHWRPNCQALVERMGTETTVKLWEHVEIPPTRLDSRAVESQVRQAQRVNRRDAMIVAAQSNPRITIEPDSFDQDPFLLNCLNGTLDLRTSFLQPHRREDFIDKVLAIPYEPFALCPLFRQFLWDITLGNQEFMEYLQRWAGYSLTGDVREQVFFLFHGPGENGKSTLLEILRKVLGPYAQQAMLHTFMQQRSDRVRTDLARMRSKRFVTASETEEGRRFDEVVMKSLTGKDTRTERFLYGEEFEFRPQCKITASCNHLPEIRGTDQGIWRRPQVVPFIAQFREVDKTLEDKIVAAELPGILAWAAAGCPAWLEQGLNPPAVVRTATADYRKRMDAVHGFLAERCEEDGGAKILTKELHEAYKLWCAQEGRVPMAIEPFGDRLTRLGYLSLKNGSGNQRLGLVLVP